MVAIDGCLCAAVAACLLRMYSNPDRVMAWPALDAKVVSVGTLDKKLDDNCMFLGRFRGYSDVVFNGVLIQPGGKVIVVGNADTNYKKVRFTIGLLFEVKRVV